VANTRSSKRGLLQQKLWSFTTFPYELALNMTNTKFEAPFCRQPVPNLLSSICFVIRKLKKECGFHSSYELTFPCSSCELAYFTVVHFETVLQLLKVVHWLNFLRNPII
jgi:hypothetical protein